MNGPHRPKEVAQDSELRLSMRRIGNIVIVLALGMLLGRDSLAQEFIINSGTDVRISPGCQVIFMGGGMVNGDGQWSNAGELVVEGNIINGAILAGGASSGIYRVSGDVENNGQMQPGQSAFHLYGSDQTMLGTAQLEFFDLHLEGSGIKFLQQDIRTAGTLNLNDRELRADVHTVFHANPASGSVLYQFDDGFVSAESGGGLSRTTNSAQSYFYPLGSAIGTPRVRPVEVTPADGSSNTYKLRFANEPSPSFNQLSSELYYINYPFHHVVERTAGSSAADITVHYVPGEDGTFETLAHRNTDVPHWTENPNTAAGPVLTSGFASFTTAGWDRFQYPEWSLATWSTDLFVPNVFSPNGDGENDLFQARGTNVRNFRMVIYDRWGNKVFESDDIMKGWDGTYRGVKMNSAVFVYYVMSGEEVVNKGNVTLLR